jgi:curved DNA-binding protein CbpA
MISDPYRTLGIDAGATDAEVRSAYRRMVQLHHPDHNRGSAESTRRFEEVQEAYSQIRRQRQSGVRGPSSGRAGARSSSARTSDGAGRAHSPPPRPADPATDSRLADLERQVREAADRARQEAEKARERARQAAREAAADRPDRPSDEELGYVHTDDSFSKIISDARDEIADRFSGAREHPVVRRVSDLIQGLDDLASKLERDRRSDTKDPRQH